MIDWKVVTNLKISSTSPVKSVPNVADASPVSRLFLIFAVISSQECRLWMWRVYDLKLRTSGVRTFYLWAENIYARNVILLQDWNILRTLRLFVFIKVKIINRFCYTLRMERWSKKEWPDWVYRERVIRLKVGRSGGHLWLGRGGGEDSILLC
jgi:hypothetical protein